MQGIQDAIEIYKREVLDDILKQISTDYPHLGEYDNLLKKYNPQFKHINNTKTKNTPNINAEIKSCI